MCRRYEITPLRESLLLVGVWLCFIICISDGKIEKDTNIELRAKYVCYQTDLDEINSDWSEILTFGSQEMKLKPESAVE